MAVSYSWYMQSVVLAGAGGKENFLAEGVPSFVAARRHILFHHGVKPCEHMFL